MNEARVYEPNRAFFQPMVETAMVGWHDRDDHFDPGDPAGGAGEKHALIRCTLFRGSNPAKLHENNGDASGYQVLCRLADGITRVPKKGALVYLIVPHELHMQCGAHVIIAVLSDDPERLETDRRVLDATGEHLIIKAKSVTLESDGGDFLSVGEPRSGGVAGVTICSADGSSGAVFQTAVASMFVAAGGDAKSLVQLTPAAAELVQKDTGFVRLKGGDITALASGKAAYLAGSSYMGTGIPALAGVASGPAGGTVSLTVFVSP